MKLAIIQARMGSSRLPGKVMKEILGKKVLWHVINRVSMSGTLDGAIVATTDKPQDSVIVKFCESLGIPVFAGQENDVLDRYYRCALKYNADDIVRITADCPLIDPRVVDKVVKEYIDGDYDYASNSEKKTYPDGFDVEVFKFSALEKAWKDAQLPSEREHVTPYIKKNNGFRRKVVSAEKHYIIHHCSLDQPEDYLFIKAVFEGIGKEMFYIDDVMDFLYKNPDVMDINGHVVANAGYLKSLREDYLFLRNMAGQ